MSKKELVDRLWDERRILVLNPAKFKIVKKGPVLIEVHYNGFLHIDKMQTSENNQTPASTVRKENV